MNRAHIFSMWVALIVMLLFIVFKFPVWSMIDEQAHFSYIEYLATENRIPIMGKDKLSWQILSITDKVYPQNQHADPSLRNFAGESYEGFQPPLYYLTSVPFFKMAGDNYYHKIYAIRLWNALLYSIFSLLVYSSISRLNISKILVPIIVFMPSFVVRSITISNAALEMVLCAGVFYYCVFCLKRGLVEWKKMFTIGFLIGLALLTKLTSIFLVPAVLLYCLLLWHKFAWQYILIILIPFIMLIPWVSHNKANYNAITPNKAAMELQADIVYEKGKINGLKGLGRIDTIFDSTFFLPEESVTYLEKSSIVRIGNNLLVAASLLTAVYSLVTLGKLIQVGNAARGLVPMPLQAAIPFFLGNMAVIAYINYTWTPSPGRYAFLTIIPLFVIMQSFVEKFLSKPKYFYTIALIYVALFDMRILAQITGIENTLLGHIINML